MHLTFACTSELFKCGSVMFCCTVTSCRMLHALWFHKRDRHSSESESCRIATLQSLMMCALMQKYAEMQFFAHPFRVCPRGISAALSQCNSQFVSICSLNRLDISDMFSWLIIILKPYSNSSTREVGGAYDIWKSGTYWVPQWIWDCVIRSRRSYRSNPFGPQAESVRLNVAVFDSH